MAHVLGIGIATLDIVNFVDRYPAEDEEVRASAQQIRRGGNVTNTLAVLTQLGHQCDWGGVLAEDADSVAIVEDLSSHGVDLRHCRRITAGRTPVSYIISSRSTGSRTIVHYRDLPEFGYEDFALIDPEPFQWIHFEGRNVADTARMLESLSGQGYERARISLEVEKPRPGIERLFAYPGLLLLSRAFARAQGFAHAEQVLNWVRPQAPGADLVCAWGEQGAWALTQDGQLLHGPARRAVQMVDSTGAGDTFNAGVIDGRLRGRDWAETLTFANDLAARKCAQLGFYGLGSNAAH